MQPTHVLPGPEPHPGAASQPTPRTTFDSPAVARQTSSRTELALQRARDIYDQLVPSHRRKKRR